MATRIIGVVLLAALLSGCAVRTEYVGLSYPPNKESGYASLRTEIEAAAGAADTTPGNCAVSLALRDERADTAMIGYTASNFGTSRINLASRQNVAAWVTDAFNEELSALGYDVTLGMWDQLKPRPVGLRVSIEETVVECYLNCMATVSLSSVHTTRSGPSEATINGEGDSMLGGWTHVGVAEAALRVALQRAVRKSLLSHDLVSRSDGPTCTEGGN